MHPLLGGMSYQFVPLHSQLPKEDQRRVFEPVPKGVTKVNDNSPNTHIPKSFSFNHTIAIKRYVFRFESLIGLVCVFYSLESFYKLSINYVQFWGADINIM